MGLSRESTAGICGIQNEVVFGVYWLCSANVDARPITMVHTQPIFLGRGGNFGKSPSESREVARGQLRGDAV